MLFAAGRWCSIEGDALAIHVGNVVEACTGRAASRIRKPVYPCLSLTGHANPPPPSLSCRGNRPRNANCLTWPTSLFDEWPCTLGFYGQITPWRMLTRGSVL